MEVATYVVYITAQNKEEAERIGRHLLKEKVAACVNIVDNIKSLFWWEGKIDEAAECLLIVKTSVEKFKKLEAMIKKIHSYQVPEIIALPIATGSQDYLDWIKSSLK